MATKKYFLDKRVLKSPTIGGSEANLQNVLDLKSYIESVVDDSTTDFTSINVDTLNESTVGHGVIADGVLLKDGGVTIADGANVVLNTTTGTKIGTATSQKLALWNTTPIVQPTTSVASATIVNGSGTASKQDDTYDGYTLAKVVKALRLAGILA